MNQNFKLVHYPIFSGKLGVTKGGKLDKLQNNVLTRSIMRYG